MKELSMAETIDALCGRRCAFALYRLPGGRKDVFCMQADGRCCDEEETNRTMMHPEGAAFVITPFEARPICLRAECDTPPRPSRFRPMEPVMNGKPATREQYHMLFERYRTRVSEGQGGLRKLVLARCRDVPMPEGFSPAAAFRRSCELSPHTFNALIHTPATGTWLCSTPELLMRGCADDWETMALAGTRRITSAPWDDKNREEQALVVEHVRRSVSHYTEQLQMPPAESLPAGEIEHLCSRMSFRMSPHLLPRLLDELHPTPAVSGYPVTEALQLLRAEPDIPRGCYAGYLGPIGPSGAQFFVMLRCMQIGGGICRLYAGGGILPDSIEEEEWLETEAKMRPMLKLLNR